MFIIYFMLEEVQLALKLKRQYFFRFWSYVEVAIIVCSWTILGVYVWRYQEVRRLGELFQQTKGFVYINLQLATYANELFTYLWGFSCFFGTIRLLRLCEYHPCLSLFTTTLRYSIKELISFALMFSIVLLAFLCLFYFLFISKMSTCATLLSTAQMLFEMSLLKFNVNDLQGAAAFLGPFSFSLFIIFVVFIGLSMFLSIINKNFRQARQNITNDGDELLSFMWTKFSRSFGLKKYGKSGTGEEFNTSKLSPSLDPIGQLTLKLDQLLAALNRVSTIFTWFILRFT